MNNRPAQVFAVLVFSPSSLGSRHDVPGPVENGMEPVLVSLGGAGA
jgi:hypothetical protein